MGLTQHYDDLPMHWVGDWAGRRAALTPQRTALYDSFTKQTYTCLLYTSPASPRS